MNQSKKPTVPEVLTPLMNQLRRAWTLGVMQEPKDPLERNRIAAFVIIQESVPKEWYPPRASTEVIWNAYLCGLANRGHVDTGVKDAVPQTPTTDIVGRTWESPEEAYNTIRALPVSERLDALAGIVRQNILWEELGFSVELLREVYDNEGEFFSRDDSDEDLLGKDVVAWKPGRPEDRALGRIIHYKGASDADTHIQLDDGRIVYADDYCFQVIHIEYENTTN